MHTTYVLSNDYNSSQSSLAANEGQGEILGARPQ